MDDRSSLIPETIYGEWKGYVLWGRYPCQVYELTDSKTLSDSEIGWIESGGLRQVSLKGPPSRRAWLRQYIRRTPSYGESGSLWYYFLDVLERLSKRRYFSKSEVRDFWHRVNKREWYGGHKDPVTTYYDSYFSQYMDEERPQEYSSLTKRCRFCGGHLVWCQVEPFFSADDWRWRCNYAECVHFRSWVFSREEDLYLRLARRMRVPLNVSVRFGPMSAWRRRDRSDLDIMRASASYLDFRARLKGRVRNARRSRMERGVLCGTMVQQ